MDVSKDDIMLISRHGYLTLDANQKTQVFVDGTYRGETPMSQYPLRPGPYKIKLVGPKKKTKLMDVMIIGGQPTDLGMIEW
jgi:hypothetical protein